MSKMKILIAKQVGMGSGSRGGKYEGIFKNLIQQEPIGLNLALAKIRQITA